MTKTIISTTVLAASATVAFAHEQATVHIHGYAVAAVGAVALAAVTFFVMKSKRDQQR